jgi:hypothetical protein
MTHKWENDTDGTARTVRRRPATETATHYVNSHMLYLLWYRLRTVKASQRGAHSLHFLHSLRIRLQNRSWNDKEAFRFADARALFSSWLAWRSEFYPRHPSLISIEISFPFINCQYQRWISGAMMGMFRTQSTDVSGTEARMEHLHSGRFT